jgi:hypothetical protein
MRQSPKLLAIYSETVMTPATAWWRFVGLVACWWLGGAGGIGGSGWVGGCAGGAVGGGISLIERRKEYGSTTRKVEKASPSPR